MPLVTLTTNNGQTLKIEGDAASIASVMQALNYTQPDESPAPVADTIEQKALKYIDFLSAELNKHVPGGKFFISEMNRLRLNENNNYRTLRMVYRDVLNKNHPDYHRHYRLLRTASAVWRYTFKSRSRSSTKNQIMHDIGCTDCGQFASVLIERLKQEKLWV